MDKINNITVHSVVTFCLCIWACVLSYNFYSAKNSIEDNAAQLSVKVDFIGSEAKFARQKSDSLFMQNRQLAKSVVYLDSCQQDKVKKSDRAERRGRFVGGLLRGFFPGL